MTFNGKQRAGLQEKVGKTSTCYYRDDRVTGVDMSGFCFRDFVRARLSLSIDAAELLHTSSGWQAAGQCGEILASPTVC